MTIPSLEMTEAGSRNQWSLAVTVQSISKDSFVLESQSSEVMPLRLPHMNSIAGALANLLAIWLLATNPN
jgi:hypothetical protein